MEFPLYILLFIYLIGVGIFLLGTFFNLYHIFKFGFFDFTGKFNTFLFIGFSLVILVISALFLYDIPWLDSFDLSDLIGGSIVLDNGSFLDFNE